MTAISYGNDTGYDQLGTPGFHIGDVYIGYEKIIGPHLGLLRYHKSPERG